VDPAAAANIAHLYTPQITAIADGAPITYTAKAAVVAIPLGVLKARGAAFFSPALDTAKQNAIARLGVGLLNKVVLEFPTTHASLGPFAGSTGTDKGAWWLERLPLASGDNGYWQEFFVLKNAITTPILVAFQAGQPALTAETTMTDTQMVDSVSPSLCLTAVVKHWILSGLAFVVTGRLLRDLVAY